MFRRKEEGLFDTDVLERTDEMESINIITPAANTQSSGFNSVTSTSASPNNASGQHNPISSRPSASVPPAPASAPISAPSSSTSTFRPAPSQQPISEAPRPRPTVEAKPVVPVVSSGAQPANKSGSRVLTVGNDILLKGEIATCDRLVIQGKVEATLNDVHTVELAEIGTFKGTANVVDAQISGIFEGDLVCTGKLIIFASGKVRGKITYGEIEIERGGELTGEIKTVSSAQNSPKSVRKEAA